ncbi:MFS transporter [Mangrovimicrobium sediminis]|uniref:MFS transporter n=1 Tax=Mangrovimicrobium sediminis TaxID=2562682 RepID=A0A4Z0LW18_9GAMM|nr:MFS transporter [Haliea sp. SAOS-164]TGD71346.1 MFS transporter [Haliea sp. SAOS-164]
MGDMPATAQQEWRAGWTLVLAASLGFAFYSVMLASTGLFMGPLGEEFGWSRTLLSSGPSIATIVNAILGPFLGVCVDRFGARKVALPGLVLTTCSILSFSLLGGSQLQWVALWLVFGVVSVSIKSTVWTTAVVGIFQKSRGLALGLTLAGTAVAQTAVPPLGNYLITEFGWRGGFVWLGLGWGGVTLVACLLFLFDYRDRLARQRKSDERAGREASAPPPAAELTGLTIPQAWRDSAIWRLAISNFIVMLLTMGLAIHLFPILTEAGVERDRAAWLVGLSGIAGIIGKLVTGVLLDRYRPNWVGGITLGVAALVFALLLYGIHSPTLILIALVVNGYAAGTKTHITGFLTAGYAGMKNFGAIYGVMSSLMALAAGLGPLLAGLVYDYSGEYRWFLLAGIAGCLLGGGLMLSMPRYPDWEPAGEKADGAAH